MALKTNFTDDILAESMNGKRQYNVTENSNGTKSLEDVTDYQSVGSTFSAKDMNETNATVNQAYDDIGDEFNPEVDYAVGDYTIHNNKVWKFTTAHPAGAWDESHVKATKILSEARELTEKIEEKPIIFSEFPGISANLSQNFVVKNKRVTGSATFTTASTNGWRYTFMTINNTDLVLDGFLVSPSGTILPIVIEDGSGMKWIKFGDYAVAQGAAYTVYLL